MGSLFLTFLVHGASHARGLARIHELADRTVAARESRKRSPASRPERPWSSLSEGERKVVDLAEGVAEDLGHGEASPGHAGPVGCACGLRGPRASGASPASLVTPSSSGLRLAPGAPLPKHGRVLMLDDLTTSVDPASSPSAHPPRRARASRWWAARATSGAAGAVERPRSRAAPSASAVPTSPDPGGLAALPRWNHWT
jgi:hypothetical protein